MCWSFFISLAPIDAEKSATPKIKASSLGEASHISFILTRA